MSTETEPHMSVETSHLEEIRGLFNELVEGQSKILNMLEELEIEEGGDSTTTKEVLEEGGGDLSAQLESSKIKAAPLHSLAEERLSSKWSIQLAYLTVLLLLAVSAFLFSLIGINQLNKDWEMRVKENMQTAIELEQAVKFFEGQKEAENARQSD